MDESCKDCYFVNDLRKDVDSMKEKVDDMEIRTAKLERNNDVFIEKFNTISGILIEIKGSINKVAWLIICTVIIAVLGKVII